MAERIPNFSTPGFPCLTEACSLVNYVVYDIYLRMWPWATWSSFEVEANLKVGCALIAGLSQMPPDNPTRLNSMSLHVNSAGTSLSPEFYNIKKSIYVVLSLSDCHANASLSEHCLSQAWGQIDPYSFPRLTFESCGLQKMLSKFLYPCEEGKRSHLLLLCHSPLIYFFYSFLKAFPVCFWFHSGSLTVSVQLFLLGSVHPPYAFLLLTEGEVLSLSSVQPCVWRLPVTCHCTCHIPLSHTAALYLFSLTQDTEARTAGFTLVPILFEKIKALIFFSWEWE